MAFDNKTMKGDQIKQMDVKSLTGTDYYLMIKEGNKHKLRHIGKASYGYRFMLRWNPDLYKDYDAFLDTIKENKIYNQFGRRVDPEFLIDFINDKVAQKPVKPYFDEIGEGHLIHILEETKDNKLIAGHPFIDKDFGFPASKIKLKN
jgi:hypothetical protein